jgi:peptidoglycan/xylan/chitin deacetylase (PgdA/CDA1 family)
MSNAGRSFVMTTSWDDGHPLDLRVAELLAKFDLAGTFYVPRSNQRPVMNSSQIRDLSQSFEIGAHTLDHLAIDQLSDLEASTQLSGSREWVEELTGKSCRVFCFPGGKFRSRQLQLVRQAGFQAARTVELLSVAKPPLVCGLHIIPTTIQAFPHGAFAYARNAAKRFSTAHFASLPAAIHSRGWIFLAEEMLNRAIDEGGVFHLWGHSWEIEEQGEWENLEVFLKVMSSCCEHSKSVTNGELCGYPRPTVLRDLPPAQAASAEKTA